MAAKIEPGLVDVRAVLAYQHVESEGTGMVVSSSGTVLTNNHVIEGAASVRVTDVGNGRIYQASVTGYDPAEDIAVLALHGASGLRTVAFGDSGSVMVGDAVVAVGNAGGRGGKPRAVGGTVTALDQSVNASFPLADTVEQLSGLIATDAPTMPGDSGGALVDRRGNVIAMNTASGTPYNFGGSSIRAYATPADLARRTVAQIAAGRSTADVHIGPTAFLGVATVNESGVTGAVVGGVKPGGPGDRAGLAASDVIASVGVVWAIAEGYPEIGTASLEDLQVIQRQAHHDWATNFSQYRIEHGQPALTDIDFGWPLPGELPEGNNG